MAEIGFLCVIKRFFLNHQIYISKGTSQPWRWLYGAWPKNVMKHWYRSTFFGKKTKKTTRNGILSQIYKIRCNLWRLLSLIFVSKTCFIHFLYSVVKCSERNALEYMRRHTPVKSTQKRFVLLKVFH